MDTIIDEKDSKVKRGWKGGVFAMTATTANAF
jgi:hypothetical protein